MSSALIRQALEFVDPEEHDKKSKKRGARKGQAHRHPYKSKTKQIVREKDEKTVEENIKKLLALSKPTADSTVAEKIVQRAVKGKPLLEKIEVKREEEKSILFPDEPAESFKDFEKEYFCS